MVKKAKTAAKKPLGKKAMKKTKGGIAAFGPMSSPAPTTTQFGGEDWGYKAPTKVS